MTYGQGALHLKLLFVLIALPEVKIKKCVVPTQVAFDTVTVVELDTFDVYIMLECHRRGEVLDRAINTFFENHFLKFSSFMSPFIKKPISVTIYCIGVFRIWIRNQINIKIFMRQGFRRALFAFLENAFFNMFTWGPRNQLTYGWWKPTLWIKKTFCLSHWPEKARLLRDFFY